MRVPPRGARFQHSQPSKSTSDMAAEASPVSLSKSYQIKCACGRPVIVSESDLGGTHHCVCGYALEIPRLEELEKKLNQGEAKLLATEKTRQAAPSNQPHQQLAVVVLGAMIFVVGAGLWVGNMSGFFPTFPFAGYLTMGLGGLILASGKAGTFG